MCKRILSIAVQQGSALSCATCGVKLKAADFHRGAEACEACEAREASRGGTRDE